MTIRELSSSDIGDKLNQIKYDLVAVESFEDRCLGASEAEWIKNCTRDFTWIIKYSTIAIPRSLDILFRKRNLERLIELHNGESGKLKISNPLNPYSVTESKELFVNILKCSDSQVIIFDISCMTSVQIIALSQVLVNTDIDLSKVIITYSGPKSYSIDLRKSRGWRDTILLPIKKKRSFRKEGEARGIIFAGYESERLSLSLSEVEPGCGCVVFTRSTKRPDLFEVAKITNSAIRNRLLTLRMPKKSNRTKNVLQEDEKWKEMSVNIDKIESIYPIIEEYIMQAARLEAPVIVYPFGPKIFTLASGLRLACDADVDSWVVYPIPYNYLAYSTTGISFTKWYEFIK